MLQPCDARVDDAFHAVRADGPVRPEPQRPVRSDPVARRRPARQLVGAARAAPDPESHQQATRVLVELPVRPGQPDADQQPVPVRHLTVPARRVHRPVGVQIPRRPAVSQPVHLLRDIRHGHRTLDGSHQTVFLSHGTFYGCHVPYLVYFILYVLTHLNRI